MTGLYDITEDRSSCGVGFITRKGAKQSHDVLDMGHKALCRVPHRGGMSSTGVGDGAGISVDLSLNFFSKLVGKELKPDEFGVGNFFLPAADEPRQRAKALIEDKLAEFGFEVLLRRRVPVNNDAIEPRGIELQLPIRQWVFAAPEGLSGAEVDTRVHECLLAMEAEGYTDETLDGFYPLSLSTRVQVLKGRLSSWEIVPYYKDLSDPAHEVHTMYFHTRFSTNTDPHPSMAQPFRLMAHNGELNTDKKNRLSEMAIATAKNRQIVSPRGQSDSCRLDQTLNSRVYEDGLDLVTAVVSMMPPAWENDTSLSGDVRAMLEYFSLYEEKNDGPAALVFGDGNIIGARLDRLGLRPLRSVETDEFLVVTSEASQIDFPAEDIIRRGRIEAGGMLFYDHSRGKVFDTGEALKELAARHDYPALLEAAKIDIDTLPDRSGDDAKQAAVAYEGDLPFAARYVAYTINQETFKFLVDPMLASGAEKVSAMGYGNAINALSDTEGGMAKYFSQRFAQVTNPPLDSIRESDGMTLRVALGRKHVSGEGDSKQIVLRSPILRMADILRIREQTVVPCAEFELLFEPDFEDDAQNEANIIAALDRVSGQVVDFAREQGGIVIVSDRYVSRTKASLPLTLAISAINQRLIEEGLRLRVSIIVESGHIISSHHIACVLGFGASAVYPMAFRMRAEEKFTDSPKLAYKNFMKAAEKSLMKIMGKVGLCTVESYSGGEFFEPNFLNTDDPVLKRYFPNMKSTVGGAGFATIAKSAADWHKRALEVESANDIPILGLFKERTEGAGHSYGTAAVRGFVDLTEEDISFGPATGPDDDDDTFRLLTLYQLDDAFSIDDTAYTNSTFDRLTPEQIDNFVITPGYRKFSQMMADERHRRPSALRDVLAFPADITFKSDAAKIKKEMMLFNRAGNADFVIRGLEMEKLGANEQGGEYRLTLTGPKGGDLARLDALAQTLVERFGEDVLSHSISKGALHVQVTGWAEDYVSRLRGVRPSIPVEEVQPASQITHRLASGAMSHGALVASAHEAVAHGTNMVGAMSNSGEGGEHRSRYGTLRASRIKQFASGRFGVWAGYLADPNLEEIEIKIGQGAKPGEGGQLPAPKVTVEIAAARGGTPGVELISPPPHHDTYSIEDLGQLIHDAKAARVRVIVKLVSSEGIGTIAVGVAKAGADIINIAGNTGGTGAASVTSLKYTGRAAEIGIAEVHQALCANGIRQKVMLRCSGAMQTGSDVVKACLLGGDSFEFGTTALMMLKCVMAKNCNVKCPAGLTTNAEVFDGDPRALAQYLLNIAHEVREILATLGFRSLDEARGRADLLHLLDHPSSIGQLTMHKMLARAEEHVVENPTYLERDYAVDDRLLEEVEAALFDGGADRVELSGDWLHLNNRNKSVGGQLSIDLEQRLNHTLWDPSSYPAVNDDGRGRKFLVRDAIMVRTTGSAGQSYGAFCNDGMNLHHTGTCNDGVGKGASGGQIAVVAAKGRADLIENVLVGNFALFGATGGRTFIAGEAGDRFAVRNSGATTVVEGVGDFCAEYMTNGAVLNIGSFAKGFGNGMSGGFAYQYDPEGTFSGSVSHDSVLLGDLGADDPMARVHSEAVHQMLEWHFEATGSAKARALLDNWEVELSHFRWVMPRALLQYQDADAIFSTKTRKQLVEEVANASANFQIAKLKAAWKAGVPVETGRVPQLGETDTDEMFRLINYWTALETAQQIVRKRRGGQDRDPANLKAVRNLILTEDFALMAQLAKHAAVALSNYSDEELAALVANKRLEDFKRSLEMRNVLSMDSLGTYGWIIHQARRNEDVLGQIPSFETLFAQSALGPVSEKMAAE